jgi:hypothetical protein
MKKTTYKIGNDQSNDNIVTTNGATYSGRKYDDPSSPQKAVSRRCDPSNPNRKMTLVFGKGGEAGTKEE